MDNYQYTGLTGQEYARATIAETTHVAWHLNDTVYDENQEVDEHIMLCVQTWTVEKTVLIDDTVHVFLVEN